MISRQLKLVCVTILVCLSSQNAFCLHFFQDLVKSVVDDVFPSLSSDLGSVLAGMPAAGSSLWLSAACHLLRLSTTTAACLSGALDQVLLKAEILPKDLVEYVVS